MSEEKFDETRATFCTDFNGYVFSFSVPNTGGDDMKAACEEALNQVREGKNLNIKEYPNEFVKAMNPELLEFVRPFLEEFYGLREIAPTSGTTPTVEVSEDFLVSLIHHQLQPNPPYLNRPEYIMLLRDVFRGTHKSERAAQAAEFVLHKARVMRGRDNAELPDS